MWCYQQPKRRDRGRRIHKYGGPVDHGSRGGWAKEQQRQGSDLDVNRFTQAELTETLSRMMVETGEDDSKPEPPAQFDVHKWVSWSKD
jgi:hypothetical protein